MIPLHFAKRFSPLTLYHRYYTPQVLNRAQHIICISQTTPKDITDFYQIPASKITAIPLAHDRTHFHYLNLPTSNYFLYIGRQYPYKNIQRFISAFAALPNCKDYELWLAGPSDRLAVIPSFKRVKKLKLNYVSVAVASLRSLLGSHQERHYELRIILIVG